MFASFFHIVVTESTWHEQSRIWMKVWPVRLTEHAGRKMRSRSSQKERGTWTIGNMQDDEGISAALLGWKQSAIMSTGHSEVL